MAVTTQENLKFKGVDFISLNYNCTKPWDDEEISLDVHPSIFLHENGKGSFEIIMHVNVVAEGSFTLETTAVGTFSIGPNASEEYKKTFMNVNSPAIMFPYVRAFISTITSSFGKSTGTIILPAQIFAGELEVINPEVTGLGSSLDQ